MVTVGLIGGLDEHNIGNEDDLAGGVVVHEYQLAPGGELDDAAASWFAAVVMRPGRVEEVALQAGRDILQRPLLAPSEYRVVESEARTIICAAGLPWPCAWGMATVACESSFRVEAWATEIYKGKRYWFHGWFQIVSTSPDPGPLADPVYNTERAAWKYTNEGTGAWPGCP